MAVSAAGGQMEGRRILGRISTSPIFPNWECFILQHGLTKRQTVCILNPTVLHDGGFGLPPGSSFLLG